VVVLQQKVDVIPRLPQVLMQELIMIVLQQQVATTPPLPQVLM